MCPVKVLLLALLSSLSLLGILSYAWSSGDARSNYPQGLERIKSTGGLGSYLRLSPTTYFLMAVLVAIVHMYIFNMMDDIIVSIPTLRALVTYWN